MTTFIIILGLIYLVLVLDSIRLSAKRTAYSLNLLRRALADIAREQSIARRAKEVRAHAE